MAAYDWFFVGFKSLLFFGYSIAHRLRYLVGNMGMLYLFQSMKFISEDAHVGSPVRLKHG